MTSHIVWTDLGDARMSADMPLPDDTRQVLKKDAPALRFNADQPRDKDGKYSMGTVAKFEHEDGRIAFVTKHNGKFHVNVLKNGVPHLPGAMYDDQEVATAKAAELLKRADDGDGEWITINGAHVFIKDGMIEKGPAAFVGKSPSDLKEKGASGESKIAKTIEESPEELRPLLLDIKKQAQAIANSYGLGDLIDNVYLVGSQAKGTATEKSDIDVLVKLNNVNDYVRQSGKFDAALQSKVNEMSDAIEQKLGGSDAPHHVVDIPDFGKHKLDIFVEDSIQSRTFSGLLYNGRLHVTLVDDDSKNVIGSSIFSGEGMKDKAIDKAQKLAGVNKRFSEDQPRDEHGRFAAGGGSAEEKPDEVKQAEALQSKMREIENQVAAMEIAHWKAPQEEYWNRINALNLEHEALLKQVQELKNTDAHKEWSAKQQQQQAADHKATIEKEVARVAKEQNYERVLVVSKADSAYPDGFTVAGQRMEAGGYADLTTGMITVIPEHTAVDVVPSLLAHEIEHERFQGALNAYNYEHQALMKLPTDELFGAQGTHGVGVLRPDGSVRPEAEGRFPATTLLQKSLEQDKFKLYDSDGCTKYSEAYWKHYVDNGRRSADGEQAMHETLAEMARIKVTTGKFPEGSNTGWRDLYRAVDKVAKSGNALWPNGRTPGYYVTGEN